MWLHSLVSLLLIVGQMSDYICTNQLLSGSSVWLHVSYHPNYFSIQTVSLPPYVLWHFHTPSWWFWALELQTFAVRLLFLCKIQFVQVKIQPLIPCTIYHLLRSLSSSSSTHNLLLLFSIWCDKLFFNLPCDLFACLMMTIYQSWNIVYSTNIF